MASDKQNSTLGCLGVMALLLIVGGVTNAIDCGGAGGGNDSMNRNDGGGNASMNRDYEFSLKYTGRERLKAQLRDPDSLQIISERLVRPGRDGGAVGYECRYRAKNGFGGYVVEDFYTE